ncbi:MAG TPA: O-antigen ligase family protein [Chitinophagaceae bacterium]
MDKPQKTGAILITLLFALGCWVAVYFHRPEVVALLAVGAVALLLSGYPSILFLILIGSIPWSVEYSATSTLSTDLPDEPLMLLVSFVVLLLVVQRRRWQGPAVFSSVLFIVLLLQAGWWSISTAFSSDTLISGKFLLAKSWYLLAFVGAPLLLLREPKDFARLGGVLVTSMMVLTVVVLVRHAYKGFTFEDINDSLSPFFRNHVNYSALLVITIPLLIAFHSAARSSWAKGLLVSTLLVALAALYLSYARGAWLALIVGGVAYWLLQKKLLLWAYITSLVLVLATVLWLKADNRYLRFAHDYETTVFHTDFREHLVATYQLKDVSTAERFYRWIAGVRMIKDNWQTGYGPNTYYYHYQRYAVPAFKTWVSKNEERSTVHNYFLLTIIEQGVMGLLLLLFLLGYMFYTTQRVYHAAPDRFWRSLMAIIAVVLSMICTVNFLSDLVETDKVGSIFYMCLGILILGELRKPSELAPHV